MLFYFCNFFGIGIQIAVIAATIGNHTKSDAIFSARGDDRLQLVVMMAVDITVYHLFCLHNPKAMSDIRRQRYERAVEWLEGIAAQRISIDGAPRLPEEEIHGKAKWKFGSNRKRTQHL